jgi:acid phosphatase
MNCHRSVFAAIVAMTASLAWAQPAAELPLWKQVQKNSLPCAPGNSLINAALWVQSSAEYRASALQTYNAARRMVDVALADRRWSATGQSAVSRLQPAVILDLDETSLDNSRFEARAVRAGVTYTVPMWDEWVSNSEAEAVPGAKEFLDYVTAKKITPFYITNRKAHEEPGTRANLVKLGFPVVTGIDPNDPAADNLFVRGERPEWSGRDKAPRRDWVSNRYRVLAVLGDDLNDFVNAGELTTSERDVIITNTAANWGTKWFMVPNPMYGSWLDILTGETENGCDELQNRIDALVP